ncbi:DUF1559 family PulG-like putative transporter [Tautonia plasticadhaerens]|uniref:DUF1559 domain-containing protein n=1 Tax=Tautonia plasticadhaerens TaxID=2527974 RepID=A0A518H5H5_9BACT|nr:DUF1559 domain-containing protein [Tautonia plasticadhaerens]QDV36096.1 hypothetical protein ElP_40080 [Tautonia plasticadhaerens]
MRRAVRRGGARAPAGRVGWAIAVAAAGALLGPPGPASAEDRVETSFEGASYDRWVFRPMPGPPGSKWRAEDGLLVGTVRPGPVGYNALRFLADVHLVGDFEVVATYDVRSLPKPKTLPDFEVWEQANVIELHLSNASGEVGVYHNHRPDGQGIGFFARIPGGEDGWAHLPTAATWGRLGIRRAGETWTLLHGAEDGELASLGEAVLGTDPVDYLALMAVPMNTTSGLEVGFRDWSIRADRVVRLQQPPRSRAPYYWAAGALLVAIAAGLIAWRWRASRDAGPATRAAATRRGFTLIEVLVVVAVIGILVALLLPAVQMARESSRRAQCSNNLRQIGLALHNYEAALRAYPFGVGGWAPAGREPRWSAHSQLLPYLEQPALFDALNFVGVPWAHDPIPDNLWNRSILQATVSGFLCPSDAVSPADTLVYGHSSYRGNAGTQPINLPGDSPDGSGRNDGAFWFQSAIRTANVRDGLGNTAMFSERCLFDPGLVDPLGDFFLSGDSIESCRSAGPMTSPRMLVANQRPGGRWADGNALYTRYHHVLPPGSPSCLLGGIEDYGSPVVSTASSRHPGGVNLLTGDGSVHFVKSTIDPEVWKAYGTVAGGEAVPGLGD